MTMNRRSFAKKFAVATATAATLSSAAKAAKNEANPSAPKAAFNMKFAPHHNHFKHHAGDDLLDQIRFAHDQGFRAWEDNRAPRREPSVQAAMGDLLQKLDMQMGVFVAFADFHNPIFAGHRMDVSKKQSDKKAVRAMLIQKATEAVEVSKRVGAKWCTVVPGAVDPMVPFEYQTANTVDHLKYMAEICEKADLVMVLEPLNYINHPGCFLQRISHAHQVCKMVGSPSCKILDDLYHQQITEGNLITNMADAWDEIAYIQVGDVPGRKQPLTGEINYQNVFAWLHDRGFDGIIGMEHGIKQPGLAGEKILVDAYRAVDVS